MKLQSLKITLFMLTCLATPFIDAPLARCADREASEKSSAQALKFDFGTGKAAGGFAKVTPETIYNKDLGYGFEPGSKVTALDRGGSVSLKGDFCTSDKPFYFSVAEPEGNYKVTVTLGDAEKESDTTIKTELRRLALEHVHTAPGEFVKRSFIANVRTPRIGDDRSVRLKEREKTSEAVAWDDKLTIEFNGPRPCVGAVEIKRVDVPTVYLLGDSTVCDQPSEPWNSWGQMLPRFFKPEMAVANNAESGESLKSSLGARRLEKVLSTIKPGDYLFIQFGHNDMKERGDGVGAFTTYKTDLKRFVADAKAKGAQPVLVTSMNRKSFNSSGEVTNTLGDYPEAVRQVAKEENVPLIDLHAMSKQLYEAIGRENIDKAFQDGTHHNNYGSYELAKCVIEGIRQNKLDLAKFIADDVPEFDPKHPDALEKFSMPASADRSNRKPDGN
jgi:lysophospholipase L1-like esterase